MPSAKLNIAALTPTPIPIDSIAMREKTGLLGQQPGAVAQVLDQVFEMAEGEDVMALFLNAGEIAKLPSRRGQGLVVAEAGASMLRGQLLDVKLQFFSKLLLVPFVEQHTESVAQPTQETPHCQPSASTAATPPAMACQRSVSRSSWRRPGGVRR